MPQILSANCKYPGTTKAKLHHRCDDKAPRRCRSNLKVVSSFQDPFEGTAVHLSECPKLEIRPRVDGFGTLVQESPLGRFGWPGSTSRTVEIWIGGEKVIEKGAI